jgi:LysR family transcriptional regulator (chromosome initiation inhibitor)
MLDYKLIEALARVIEEGGFIRAAEALCLTQSAVSQRVRQLEEGCGQILLTRGNPPQPTTAGVRLLKHYRQVRLLEDGLDAAGKGGQGTTLTIGVNADSLASWFLEAVRPLLQSGLLFDLRVDDQEQTHRLLRDGEVIGCISTESRVTRGCRMVPLGSIVYRLLATAEFARRWFPEGFTLEAAELAPAVLYNLKDRLHHNYCEQLFGKAPTGSPAHYIPRPEQLFQLITEGFAYGLVPDWQSARQLGAGDLVNLRPENPYHVKLYWHCWNLDSEPLLELTSCLSKIAGDCL